MTLERIMNNKNRTQLTSMNLTDQFATFAKSTIADSTKEGDKREERRSVLDYLKNNKIFKTNFQDKEDHLSISAKKKAFNKVIRLHQAFSNKRFEDADDNSPA